MKTSPPRYVIRGTSLPLILFPVLLFPEVPVLFKKIDFLIEKHRLVELEYRLPMFQVKELQVKLSILLREKTEALFLRAQAEEQHRVLAAQLKAKVRIMCCLFTVCHGMMPSFFNSSCVKSHRLSLWRS